MNTTLKDAPRPRRVRPYPLDELPRLLRAQVELSRVLWRHLHGLVDASTIGSAAGLASVEETLGGPLKLAAQEPYLAAPERLPALLRGARPFELSLITPGQPAAILLVEDRLCQRLGYERDDRISDLLADALHGAPLRIGAVPAEDVASILGRDETQLRSLLVLDVVVTARGEQGLLRLLTSAQLRLSAPPPKTEAALQRSFERRQRLSDVKVALPLEAGYGFLPGRELLSVQAGDIVMLDHFGPKPVTGGPVWLRLGGGVFPGHLDGDGVTMLGSFYLRAQAMPQSTQESSEGEGGAPEGTSHPANEALLRELPVQVTCEIGRVTLSAREVLELRPGAVVPVGRPLAGPVDLTAGGRVIARGELVDVEGEIGVRVTELQE